MFPVDRRRRSNFQVTVAGDMTCWPRARRERPSSTGRRPSTFARPLFKWLLLLNVVIRLQLGALGRSPRSGRPSASTRCGWPRADALVRARAGRAARARRAAPRRSRRRRRRARRALRARAAHAAARGRAPLWWFALARRLALPEVSSRTTRRCGSRTLRRPTCATCGWRSRGQRRRSACSAGSRSRPRCSAPTARAGRRPRLPPRARRPARRLWRVPLALGLSRSARSRRGRAARAARPPRALGLAAAACARRCC